MNAGDTALVTGATGFVGRHLVRLLVARGVHVRALIREPDRILMPEQVSVVRGELANAEALRAATRGVDVVFHLAGRAHVLREDAADPLDAFRRANVQGTRSLLEAAAASRVARFVNVSSASAVCTTSDAIVTDDMPPRPGTPYGVSKLEAERLVATIGAERGVATVSVRPSMVYGPGQRGNPQRLFGLVARHTPLPLRSVRNRRSLMYVGNLVDALLAAATLATERGDTYMLSDPGVLSTPELVRRIAAELGTTPILLPLPDQVGRVAARAMGWAARRLSLPVVSDEWDRLAGSFEIDATRFRLRAHFASSVGLSDGLAETARWYLAEHRAR